MKRAALFVLPAFMVLVGCSEQEPDSISVVDENGDAVEIVYAASTADFYSVNIIADSWTVKSSADWCIPQKDLGYQSEKLDIYVDDFADNSSSRQAFVTFVSGMASQTIMFVQESSDNFVNLFPSEASVDYKSQSLDVVVAANFDNWTVKSTSAWAKVTADVDNNTFGIDIEENESEEERAATIYVTFDNTDAEVSGTASAEFVLTQAGRSTSTLDLSVSNYTFDAPEDTTGVAVEATTTLFNPTFAVSSSTDWCKVSATDAAAFSITADANVLAASRSAVVTVVATSEDGKETLMETIKLTQNGVETPYVKFDTSIFDYSAAAYPGEAISFSANEGTLSAVTSDPAMITAVAAANGSLTFDVAENTAETSRTATITVTLTTAGGETASATITINQDGYEKLDLALSVYEATISAAVETLKFKATSATGTAANVVWECAAATSVTTPGAETSVTFPANGSTTASVTYVVSATLTENGQTVVKHITVTQKAASDAIVPAV